MISFLCKSQFSSGCTLFTDRCLSISLSTKKFAHTSHLVGAADGFDLDGVTVQKLMLAISLSFSEALDNMYDEKIEDITILPLYILPGGQYEGVKKVLHCYKEKFNNIKIAKPLLNGEKNEFQDVILAIKSHLPKDKGIVLVGHGTKDEYNKFYKMLEDNFRENNIDNVYVATLEYGKSNIQLAKELKGLGLNDIYIAPFLIVCGSHVVKDINGDENEKSWKNVFKSQGFNVEVSLKSLGEYDEILDLYIKKIKRILNKDIK